MARSKRGERTGKISDSCIGLGEGNRGEEGVVCSCFWIFSAGRVVDMLCNRLSVECRSGWSVPGLSGRGGDAVRGCREKDGESRNGCLGMVEGLCEEGDA